MADCRVSAGPIADVRAARLEVEAVRNRADLQPFILAGRPHFDVVRLRRVEPNVSGAEFEDAVGDAQLLGQGARPQHKLLELCFALIRFAVDEHFDFFELVAALDAAHVPAGAHFFAPEARCVRNEPLRQRTGGQDLIAIEVDERNFGGGDEEVVLFGVVIKVVAKLRELARCPKRGLGEHVR